MDAAYALRTARRAAGLSQVELARRAGTSQAAVSAYESGHKRPAVATLDRLLRATGRRLDVVAAGRPVRTPGPDELADRGRRLADVLELAEALPHRPSPELRFPVLAARR